MSDEFLGVTTPVVAESEQPAAPAQVGNSGGNYDEFLQAITNSEGKPKYKTVADALIGAVNAQSHISKIEQENAELRTVAKKVETLEQVLARLETGSQGATSQVVPKVEDQEQLVISVLEKREAANRDMQNRQTVLGALKEKYGDKVSEVLALKANDLGMTVHDLGQLASRSPKAVLEYFKVETKGTPNMSGTVNSEALKPQDSGVKVPDNIMWGAKGSDVIDLWRAIGAEVQKEINAN